MAKSKINNVETIKNNIDDRINAIYVRCGSKATKEQLDEKVNIIQTFLLKNGISPELILKEKCDFFVTDYKRHSEFYKLLQLVEENKIKRIYIYNIKDFSVVLFDVFQYICNIHKTTIVLVAEKEQLENEKDIMRDELAHFIYYIRSVYDI